MLLLATLALADSSSCITCCRQNGLEDCSAELRVVGERSVVTASGDAWEVTGLWVLGCGGDVRFLAGAFVGLDHQPQQGEIVGDDVSITSVKCFGEACSLPARACVTSSRYGGFALQDCSTFQPISDRALQGVPAGAVLKVSVEGRTIVGERYTVEMVEVPPQPEHAYVDPVALQKEAVVATPPAPATGLAPMDMTLPPDPPVSCNALSEVVAREARRRVDSGDDRRLAGDYGMAFKEYRASLTMDPCNHNAWIGLGHTAMALGRPDLAIHALRDATTLNPSHYGAWTMLGQAYEAILQRGLAYQAYVQALALSPGYSEAVEGAARTR